jgi:large subunit ribosomal protein L25
MLTLSAKLRKVSGKKVKSLRKKGLLPGVLYGFKTKNLNLEVDLKEFEKVFKTVGKTSLISLKIDNKKIPVLIQDFQKNPLTGEFIHVDFYHPHLKEKIEASVPLVFEGEAPAVKELGGTLVRHLTEIRVKALPLELPHEIKIDVSSLKTFDDEILVESIKLPKGVDILNNPKEIIAFVSPPEAVEEELEKPIEEKVEEVERVEEKEEEEEE